MVLLLPDILGHHSHRALKEACLARLCVWLDPPAPPPLPCHLPGEFPTDTKLGAAFGNNNPTLYRKNQGAAR